MKLSPAPVQRARLAVLAGLLTVLVPLPSAAHAATGDVRIENGQLVRNGHQFVPRGFTMIGALSPDGTDPAATHLNSIEMAAAAGWGANAVRFQLSQPALDPLDALHSDAYLDRVRSAVGLARSSGFQVTICMQDQGLSGGTRHPQPTAATIRAWQAVAPLFNDDLAVVYEMFNEPQNAPDTAGWQVWRDGDPTVADPPVGHQPLLEEIRATGSRNVVLADGAHKSLNGVPELADPIGQVGYAVHPYLGDNNRYPADWDANFGNLSGRLPVVATEWNATSTSPMCKPEWPTTAPQLLSYCSHTGSASTPGPLTSWIR